jgi:hypothetical protein
MFLFLNTLIINYIVFFGLYYSIVLVNWGKCYLLFWI